MYEIIALHVSVRLIVSDCLDVARILQPWYHMRYATPVVVVVLYVGASVLLKSMFVCHLQRFVFGGMLESSGSP
jgi:hypothetical protein